MTDPTPEQVQKAVAIVRATASHLGGVENVISGELHSAADLIVSLSAQLAARREDLRLINADAVKLVQERDSALRRAELAEQMAQDYKSEIEDLAESWDKPS